MKKVLFISTIIISLLSAYLVQCSFVKNESYSKSWEFYQNSNPNEYDLLIIGSSHLTMSISPLQLWNEYEITSYNMADFGQTMNENYWILKYALEKMQPKLVVLDAYGLFVDETIVTKNSENFHSNVDAMPLCGTKISMIKDIVSEDERLYYFFPLSYIHEQWGQNSYKKSLDTLYSFKGEALDTRDVEQNVPIYDLSKERENDLVTRNESSSTSREYMRKSIELCKEKGINVLLLNTPSRYSDDKQAWTNSANTLAEEYGVEFLELNRLNKLVNLATDFRDEGHVNSSGARKITTYLGDYVLKNYNVKTDRDDNQKEKWNKEYDEYREYILQQIKNQVSLDSFLTLLYHCSFDVVLEITDIDILSDEYYSNFLNNLGCLRDNYNVDNSVYLVMDGKTNEMSVVNDLAIGNNYATCIGNIKKEQKSEGGYTISLNEMSVLDILDNQIENKVIRFGVLDDGEIVYRGSFLKRGAELSKYDLYIN